MKGDKAMKRLRKKSGFTLVECVVAMAILAIMTLMLAMMMNIIVSLRNDNRNTEEKIDQQVEYLINDESTVTEKIPEADADIDFGNNVVIKGDKANKVYFNDPNGNAQIGKVDYGIDPGEAGTPDTQPPVTSPGETTPAVTTPANDKKVYGALDLNPNYVNINETKSGLTDGIYNVTWTFSFQCTNVSDILSLKIAFPNGSKLISYTPATYNCEVHYLGNRVVRMKPQAANQNVTVNIDFEISETDYNNNVGSVENYFKGSGNGSNVSVPINT